LPAALRPECPALGLTCAQADHSTCDVLPNLSVQVGVYRHCFGIVQRCDRLPQRSYGDPIVIPYRRPESVPQTNSHVVFVLHHQR
jgi:hypothetical protein